jgi:transcriptional regulator with XRE-family HTH domain
VPRRKPGPDLLVTLGQVLRRYRLNENLTQEALAERAEMHATYISGLERGQRNPTYSTLDRLLAALGKTWLQLARDVQRKRGTS